MLRLLPSVVVASLLAGTAAAQGLGGGTAASPGGIVLYSDTRPADDARALPLLDPAPQGRVFTNSVGGFTLDLSPTPGSPWSTSLAVDFRRDDHLGEWRRGLSDPQANAEFGVLGQFTVNQWRMAVDLRHDPQNDGRGTQAELGLFYGAQLGSGLTLSVGPTLSVTAAERRSYLGITPASRARRGDAEAGFKDYGLRGTATYSLSENWALTGVLGYRRSFGDAGEIPAGDVGQFLSILGFGYRF